MNPQEILQARSLSDRQAAQVLHLTALSQQHDNASSCIQMEHTLNADQEMHSWFLASICEANRGLVGASARTQPGLASICEANRGLVGASLKHVGLASGSDPLVGVASVFAPSREEAEISLCVAPSHRGQGIGNYLLDQAATYLRSRGIPLLLLVCDRGSHCGMRFAEQRSRGIQHTEHEMRLAMPFTETGTQGLIVEKATLSDLPAMMTICHSAYGAEDRDFDAFLRTSLSLADRVGYIGKIDGLPVAVCFVGIHTGSVSINTVAVLKALQGQGLGRAFLSCVIRHIEGEHPVIDISVDSTNAPAYALYRRLGFVDRSVVDYHIL